MNIFKKIGIRNIIILAILIIIILSLIIVLFKNQKKVKQVVAREEKSIASISLEEIEFVVENQEEIEEQKEQIENKNNNTKYYIKVNYGANTVTIYSKDSNSEYSKPVKAMICSCGTSTPKSGVYKTSKGYEWGTLVGGTFGRYSTRIVGNILFHSVPYTSMSSDSLEYWEYDKLGTTASLGCVRLTVEDCKWIFYNVEVGTPVEFYSDSNPGPLGKPTARKISNNEECRNWDPTDTDPQSPWNKSKESIQEVKQETKQEIKEEVKEETKIEQEKIEEVKEEAKIEQEKTEEKLEETLEILEQQEEEELVQNEKKKN